MATVASDWTSREVSSLRKKLAAWSKRTPREMPWRGIGDPYRVWISEIMLQQTTVAAVIPYYLRFMERFPDLASLAAAQEQDVLAAWEGLGYYSRGRNLHRAALAIVAEHDGRFPRTVEQLQSLPGIGRYTAGAIASFALDLRAPILEANTQRVYARLTGYAQDPRTAEGQAFLWSFAENILPPTGAGGVNQSLIDLGALICTPSVPRCPDCPVVSLCRAFRDGQQNQIPPPKTRPKVTEVHELAIAVRHNGQWLVRQRPTGERWAGMWDFPRLSLTEPLSGPGRAAVSRLQELFEATGIQSAGLALLPPFTHSVTRYRIQLCRLVADYVEGNWRLSEATRWLTLAELEALPMPMAARRFARDLADGDWDPAGPFSLTAAPRPRRGRPKRSA